MKKLSILAGVLFLFVFDINEKLEIYTTDKNLNVSIIYFSF